VALQKKTLKQSEVSTEINLEKILGKLSQNEDVRAVFFESALEKMQQRLDEGRGVDGSLGTYSESYKDSLAFKVFGKSNPVNMQLTGDMLTAVNELDSSQGKIKIGITDEFEAAKAYGHITGMKGHPTLAGKVPKRNWFGWSDKELTQIANAIKPEVSKRNTISDVAALKILERLLG
jgi:hypothetical protein